MADVNIDELKEKNVYQSEVLVDKDLMSDAFQGENREHEMGVWTAVKAYPMATLWAFIFCFAIVSHDGELSAWPSAYH